ncbi:Arc family DNA-binding protein [Rhizobium sp. 11_C7_N12_5]|uniref:Arc family DNA-binding protein n=1 Tax=Rhizobium sp. 11_C7_N12_5 TaxID=3240770 RepID=UPI003F25D076
MALAGRDSEKFLMRLPDGLRARIKVAAQKNVRSMNSELLYQLEKIYPEIQETEKADATA